MSKGMISNFVEADNYMIDNYDEFVCAMHFDTLSKIREWTEEEMSWAKTTLKIKANIEGGK